RTSRNGSLRLASFLRDALFAELRLQQEDVGDGDLFALIDARDDFDRLVVAASKFDFTLHKTVGRANEDIGLAIDDHHGRARNFEFHPRFLERDFSLEQTAWPQREIRIGEARKDGTRSRLP